eukprot:TRINITY_DN721_c0_g5_i4.p1 TRINITY_DN721_c0_g5~~TRINITY_DN721_c0_g5_i4.p1  ORF type:complete len:606 (-),score=122.28 TRINITY_DN721_c0_g5_i4:113-1930(-)
MYSVVSTDSSISLAHCVSREMASGAQELKDQHGNIDQVAYLSREVRMALHTTPHDVSRHHASDELKMLSLHSRCAPILNDTGDFTQESIQQLLALVPDESGPSRWSRWFWLSWILHLQQHHGMIAPDMVAQLGRTIYLIDIRSESEVSGGMGYIPGSDWLPYQQVDTLVLHLQQAGEGRDPRYMPVVLVGHDDVLARKVAADLQQQEGFMFVAAMVGGILEWKNLGYGTRRDNQLVQRKGLFHRRSPVDVKLPPDVAAANPAPVTSPQSASSTDPNNHELSLAEITEHVGQATNLQWLKMATFMLNSQLSCVDGRDPSGVVGTPGGDIGELVVVLAAAEQVSGQQLTEQQVETIFWRRLDAFGRCYLHSDVHAMHELRAALDSDAQFQQYHPLLHNPFTFNRFVQHPPADIQGPLLDLLINPRLLGCGHIRLMLQNSEVYQVRPELVQYVLRAFFRALWKGAAECDFVVLSGQHREGAVVVVQSANPLHSFSYIPLVTPACEAQKQVFVDHSQVAGHLRKELARFVSLQRDIIQIDTSTTTEDPRMLDTFFHKLDSLANLHLQTTLGHLACGLPLYQLNFLDDHRVTVRHGDIENVVDLRSPSSD